MPKAEPPVREVETTAALKALAPTDPLMRCVWLDAVAWAVGHAELMADFRAATGLRWHAPSNHIERLIDEATDASGAFLLAFVRWFNREHWGEVEGRASNGNEEIDGN